MKALFKAFVGGVLCLATSACDKPIDEFLDKAPGVDVTENTIFSSRVQLENFITGTYRIGIHSPFPYNDGALIPTARTFCMNAPITDEAECEVTFMHPETWNAGSVVANSGLVGSEDERFFIRWTAIRNCNIILERLDEVPLTDSQSDKDYKNQVIGEVKFIRALNYSEMLKRYGGVPIIDKRLSVDEGKVPRSSVEDVVNFIVRDCDEAIAKLPATYPSTFRGRATRTAAHMLKSRTLLYAASPLFNTATPYLALGSADDNKLLCYGNQDNTRWKLAADAAKAAIDAAPAGAFALINTPDVNRNYKIAWEQTDNAEIVLAEKAFAAARRRDQYPFLGIQPLTVFNSFGGISVIHNFVRKYEKKDGTPQTWPGGNNLLAKYNELDPRFAQTVGFVTSRYNAAVASLETFEGGLHARDCEGGAWLKKFIPDALSASQTAAPNSIVFRLAEAYLNYAEALNEAQGPLPAAYDAVNRIRQRSGMPVLPPGLSKDQFRARVHNERDIELAFENHRLWDIRRWKVAEQEGVMKGAFQGLRITRVTGSTDFAYQVYKFEDRTFQPRMYLHPFPANEVFKGYLVQNPGY
ncbi:RagB/SusD family nutrient uptake outer membrane protein [Hymenobacter terrenus]|uniref:RagB/SusD family nutrient uptake outer membrane protein n=1 Tax=Hymenobacter terrenus TaxID=1629124 RepID=UPI000695D179|nr:RagB/SusD family nutrient uptake outer membrane protein [Hymenobacter terrenus]